MEHLDHAASLFEPHGHCFLWMPDLIALHALSDLVTGLSYYLIPFALFYFVQKRHDVPYKKMFLLFGLFIIACGSTHLMAVWTIWHADYWLEGIVKLITAVVSLSTAVLLVPIIPKALAIPSSAQLKAANAKLESEISRRVVAEQELLQHKGKLEDLVALRTDELQATNTRLLHAQATLEEKNLFLSTLLESIPNPVFYKDLDGKIIGCNDRYAKLHGFSHQTLLGKTAFDIFPRESAEKFHASDQEVITAQKTMTYENDLTDATGQLKHVIVNKAPFLDGQGRVAGVVGVYNDVTELKRIDQELRSSEERFRHIIETSLEGVWSIDKDLRTTYVNPRMADMLGYEPDEMLGRTFSDFMRKDQLADYDHRMSERKLGQDTIYERCFLRRDGGELWTIVSPSGIFDTQGQFTGSFAMFTDITARKQAEEQRAQLNAALEAKNTELEQVIYVASHDLRSPLVNIDGYSKELNLAFADLGRALADNPAARDALRLPSSVLAEDIPEALRFIQTSVSKMDVLLTGLLRLSRLGRAALHIELLDMNKLISRIADSTEFKIKEAAITLDVADLPPCEGDALQLIQVFSNLLDNAIKYRDPDRPGVIRISGRTEPGRSVYCVADNGIGIAQAHMHKIFEIFHRLDPQHGEGEGLGLTIVKRIMARLEGDVWVESEVGSGSHFYVSLPTGRL
jgi:PAS domain S-box-containing protein